PTVAQRAVAIAIALAFLFALIVLHVLATRRSLQEPRAVQDALQHILDPVQARLLQPLTSRQDYPPRNITERPRPNGRPPRHNEYCQLVARGFDGWRFEISGLVEHPSLVPVKGVGNLELEHEITVTVCSQACGYVAAWKG